MSSFVGHSLAALTVNSLEKPAFSRKAQSAWAGWLIALAAAPDIDYAFQALHLTPPGLRVAHSLVGSLALPFVTIVVLVLWDYRGNRLHVLGGQAVAAGLSHLALDLLVGVTPEMLLWPFSPATFRLPFGILPSAGQLSLFNALLYRNLLIEMGVLAPVFTAVYLIRYARYKTRKQQVVLIALFLIAGLFMMWATGLAR